MNVASPMQSTMHVYEVRPRKDHRGFDLISDALPFGRLWYGEPNAIVNAIGYAKHRSRSHDVVIRVYDEAGNVIQTHTQGAISKSGERFRFEPRGFFSEAESCHLDRPVKNLFKRALACSSARLIRSRV